MSQLLYLISKSIKKIISRKIKRLPLWKLVLKKLNELNLAKQREKCFEKQKIVFPLCSIAMQRELINIPQSMSTYPESRTEKDRNENFLQFLFHA